MSLGKASKEELQKKLDWHILMPNQLVYAYLLIPGVNCDTQIGAVLVIMDVYRKVVTTYMLRTKASDAVAAALKQYFSWDERQARRHATKSLTMIRLNIQFASC